MHACVRACVRGHTSNALHVQQIVRDCWKRSAWLARTCTRDACLCTKAHMARNPANQRAVPVQMHWRWCACMHALGRTRQTQTNTTTK
jgi:hypothetical protein